MMENYDDPFDRLRNDTVLGTIVSFLPFKEAARTSILSKRWRNVWHSTRNVEFSEKFFIHKLLTRPGSQEPYTEAEIKEIRRQHFCEFARNFVSSYQELEVKKFCLSLSQPDEFVSDVQNWIEFFAERNLEELDLDFFGVRKMAYRYGGPEAAIDIPKWIFSSLKSLKFSSLAFNLPRSTNFQAMREIAFSWVEITSESLTWLVSKCEFLEILSLERCKNLERVDISKVGLKLRHLSIFSCSPLTDLIIVAAKNLRFFQYYGTSNNFILYNLDSIEEFDIDFEFVPDFDSSFGDTFYYQILPSLSSAKIIRVCSYIIQALSTVTDVSEPIALDVRHLKIRSALDPSEFKGILFLLNSCWMLEKLTIEAERPVLHIQVGFQTVVLLIFVCTLSSLDFQGYDTDFDDPISYWRQLESKNPSDAPNADKLNISFCFLRSLKVVEIYYFRGTVNEMQFLTYLLKKVDSLDMMIIHTAKKLTYKAIAHQLLDVNKASTDAAIVIT